jgi:hypothetical protein
VTAADEGRQATSSPGAEPRLLTTLPATHRPARARRPLPPSLKLFVQVIKTEVTPGKKLRVTGQYRK